MNGKTGRSGYDLVFESSSDIAELLRLAAHSSRIEIMTLTIRGEGDFSKMMQITNLSKTALANHISQLVNSGLMERRSRGRYELTSDGKRLLAAAFSTYKSSLKRSQREKELVRHSYSRAFGNGGEIERHLISRKVHYQPCWLSLLGSCAGALTALGKRCSAAHVGGYSGYSFLINVAKGETCPSGPTAIHPKTFRQMISGIEDLGWKIDAFEYPHSYPSKHGSPSSEELQLVMGLFQRIRREITKKNRPVVLWGLAAPEYGIVYGYEGDSYLVSTFRSLLKPGVAEEPIPYQNLNAPGCIDAFFFKEKVKVNPVKARREALARALSFAEGDIDILGNYVAGPVALEEWATVLEELPEKRQNYMGNSYVGACVQEGRALSATFLKGAAKKMPASSGKHLSGAASAYSKGARVMSDFVKIFPFGFKGRLPAGKRSEGAVLLRRVISHEERAIQKLKQAL